MGDAVLMGWSTVDGAWPRRMHRRLWRSPPLRHLGCETLSFLIRNQYELGPLERHPVVIKWHARWGALAPKPAFMHASLQGDIVVEDPGEPRTGRGPSRLFDRYSAEAGTGSSLGGSRGAPSSSGSAWPDQARVFRASLYWAEVQIARRVRKAPDQAWGQSVFEHARAYEDAPRSGYLSGDSWGSDDDDDHGYGSRNGNDRRRRWEGEHGVCAASVYSTMPTACIHVTRASCSKCCCGHSHCVPARLVLMWSCRARRRRDVGGPSAAGACQREVRLRGAADCA